MAKPSFWDYRNSVNGRPVVIKAQKTLISLTCYSKRSSNHCLRYSMLTVLSISRHILFHLKTLYLFTKSDFKTILFPVVSLMSL